MSEARQASDPEDATCGEALEEISQATLPEAEAQHTPIPGCFSGLSSLLLDDSLHRKTTPNTLRHDSAGEGDSDSNDEAEALRVRLKSDWTRSPQCKGSCREGLPCDWCARHPKLSAVLIRLRESRAEDGRARSPKARTELYHSWTDLHSIRYSQSPRNTSSHDNGERAEWGSDGRGLSREDQCHDGVGRGYDKDCLPSKGGGEEDRDDEGSGKPLLKRNSRRMAAPARTTPRTGIQQHRSQGPKVDDGRTDDDYNSPPGVDSEDEDRVVRQSDSSQDGPRRSVGRRQHGNTDGEQHYRPPIEDSDGLYDEDVDDVIWPLQRKRRKLSPPSHTPLRMANGRKTCSDAAPGRLRQVQRSGPDRKRSGHRCIPSPLSSQSSSEEGWTEEGPVAKFEEWPLPNAVLKRVTVGGVRTFQLVFSWDSCANHGRQDHAAGNPQDRIPVKRRLTTKRVAATRLAFTPEEDDLLIKLKGQGLLWKNIYEQLKEAFPQRERSLGTLQSHYCTKLKVRQVRQRSEHSSR